MRNTSESKPATCNCHCSCCAREGHSGKSNHNGACDETRDARQRTQCCCCICDRKDHGGVPGGPPGRPGPHRGDDSGRLDDPNPVLTPGDLTDPKSPGDWTGSRPQLFLPYLFMRANPGDTGARPVVGPFWESPDVLLLAGVDPIDAPPIPPELGQTALANKPNTLYAHIWNFGQAMAGEIAVEFYWCDPSIGFNPAGAHLIAQTFTTLGARGSGSAHRVVKCPVAWVPTFVNNGHECLLVRIWDMASDPLSSPPWDARLNRHLGQRNIHVVPAPTDQQRSRMRIRADGSMHPLARALAAPLTLKVGPLFGEPAHVTVERAAPHSMPWLQLRTGERGKFPAAAPPTGAPMLSPPKAIGGGVTAGVGADQHEVIGDDQQVGFITTDAPPAPGEAHVYRVTASQGGALIGGYTVVLTG